MCCATCGHLISNDDCTKAQADGADKVFLDPTEFEVAKHFKCQEYSGIKQMVLRFLTNTQQKQLSTAVANSITRPCPSCGLRGLKDDGYHKYMVHFFLISAAVRTLRATTVKKSGAMFAQSL